MAKSKYSLLDLTGQRFGRLVALRMVYLEGEGHIKYWECQCDCGTLHYARACALVPGWTKSCGCLCREQTRERNLTHGMSKTSEYRIWSNMRRRCSNPDCAAWPNYGGRGIKVCERWESFDNFIADMGQRPSLKHTVERINNDGDYCPENCRWATRAEQNLNYSRNHRITFGGETLTLSQWSKRLGMKQHALIARIEHGWTEEMALTIPIRSPRFVTYHGQTRRLYEWAELLGVKYGLLEKRLRLGWSVEEAFETPVVSYDLTYNGKTQSTAKWAEDTGIPQKAIQYRLAHGWTIEKTLTTPKAPRSPARGPLTYNGETLSQTEWARRLNVQPSLIEKRLRLGWSIEETLTIPVMTEYQNKKKPKL
jgi:hypothetical protein